MPIYNDFSILKRKFHGKRLVYLDSAATAQKPKAVLNAVRDFAENHNANVHRGIYALSEEATELFENSRKEIARFIDARDEHEIVFVRGATEGINLVAYSWGKENIKRGDEILISIMEHHSNFLPWQRLAKEKGAKLVVVGLTKDGLFDIRDFSKKLSWRTKLVALTQASNVLGTINPIEKISKLIAKRYKLRTRPVFFVDGAQSIPHMRIDVKKLGCDFFVFSGHKLYGPTGIGVLWGRKELLETMAPYQVGGHMIKEVYLDRTVWNDVPWKFEAGTPHAAGVVGLGAAAKYLAHFSMDKLRKHEKNITSYALKKLSKLSYVTIYGPKNLNLRTGLVSFNLQGIHAHDVASALDEYGIAVRAGHHCAMPLHTYLHLDSTVRASFGIYTTKKDIDTLVEALKKIYDMLKPEHDLLGEEQK
ncbi:MAG: hypothetical protein A3A80_01125 [Candidatus Terrybacteria bacterium RIFCSPLOWO2_01_FULL_44_24]|nr:MAG: hypothetical protein A3B75_02705 [Candidatus Terrybacteria bacterium RIFCSPHIGHO2_02_FULL_43_14]OHA50664.1 MAG: hypothetical protein A3A80_01125 [Candidatus Terrybacteria bacterium RIFCSPLOWO2_01_FULL_44_24]